MKASINDNAGYSNRVLDALRVYAEQEAHLKIANPRGYLTDRSAIQLKYQHYTNIQKALKKGANPEENKSLRYIRHERAKLRAKLRPNIVRRILYSRVVDTVSSFVRRKYGLYKWHNRTLQNNQQESIRSHNLMSLQDSLKKAGFNRSVEGPLQKMIDLNVPEFHIRYNDPLHCKNTDYVLHFKKIPGSDIYYFEKFDAAARPTLQSVLNNDTSSVKQSFSLLDKMDIKAGEAANLVNGRAVCKEIIGKEAWLSLDLTRRNEQQGYPYKTHKFDLEKALEKLPIKQLDKSGQRASLLESLKTGSIGEVTLIINGQSVKYHIEAAPHLKTINILDKNDRLQDVTALIGSKRNYAIQKLARKDRLTKDSTIINMDAKKSIKLGIVNTRI